MTDKLIEQIKADREAGTPGPWRIQDCESYGDRCKTFFKEVWNDETDILVTTEVTRAHNDGGTANMRRIARVPEYEARILADAEVIKAAEDHLVKRLKALQTYFDLSDEELESMTRDERADTIRQHRLITEALDAFNRSMQGRKENNDDE